MRLPGPREMISLRRRQGDHLRRVKLPVLALGAGAIAAGHYRRALGLPPAATTAIVASAPLSAAAAITPGRVRNVVVWCAQMWAYKYAFEVPHDDVERHRQRLHVDYPIRFDTWLGRGKPPSRRLQERLRRPPRVSPLDRAAFGVYALWELEPHLALIAIMLRRPERFGESAGRLAATFDSTLIGYWALPSAPPWWASEKLGRMDGSVRRVSIETMRELRRQPRPIADHEVGENPWGAMPSDHFASALMTAVNLRELGPVPAVLGWSYAALLGFALVYMGEHYVLDLIAGAALTAGVCAAPAALVGLVAELARRWPHP